MPRAQLPSAFIQRQLDMNGERGRAWVEALPALIAECEAKWHITVGAPFGLSYNFAAPATHASGTQLVLKAVAPYLDVDTEADALRLYDGRGAIRLIAHNAAKGVLLLERCLPGDELATLVPEYDDEATAIAADVMTQLWRPLPAAHPFPTLAEWTGVLDRLYGFFGGSTGPMDKRVVDTAIRLRGELLASAPEPLLLHGDLHHHNILRASFDPSTSSGLRMPIETLPKVNTKAPSGAPAPRVIAGAGAPAGADTSKIESSKSNLREAHGDSQWLAIDPKGIAGEKAYEPASFFYNPLGDWHTRVDGPRTVRRRIDIMSERAGLDKQRVIGWAVVQGIVSSAWDYEGDPSSDRGWQFCEQVAAWALDLLEPVMHMTTKA